MVLLKQSLYFSISWHPTTHRTFFVLSWKSFYKDGEIACYWNIFSLLNDHTYVMILIILTHEVVIKCFPPTSASGLVVKFSLAMAEPPVQFRAGAQFFHLHHVIYKPTVTMHRETKNQWFCFAKRGVAQSTKSYRWVFRAQKW